jgi:hypothetical protein
MADYVNNKQFLALILEYRETESIKIFNKLGRIFLEICDRVHYKPNFVNYSNDVKEDATSDACYYMTKYLPSFDEKKYEYPNPFAYFTQIAIQAMVQNINKLHKKEENTLSLDFIDNFNENGVGTSSESYRIDSQIMNDMTNISKDI